MDVNALVRTLGRVLMTAGVYRLMRKAGAPTVIALAILGAMAFALSGR